MHTNKVPYLMSAATAVAVAALVTCIGLAPATASSGGAPSATPTATAGVTPPPTSAPSPGTSTVTGKDPDLATQNKAHNHAMGSTIPQNQPGSTTASPNVTASPSAVPPGLPGLDVSGWQTNIDWSQVAANGAKFVYIKATESTDYVSSQFASQYSGSYAAGLTRGAYHFATPNTSSGATQANYFVDNGGGWSQDGRTLPPLLDIEYNPYGATCYGLSQAAMVSWIADFSNTVFKRTSRYPAIYSTTDWWTQCTGNSAAFGINPLFIARYPNSVSDGPGTLPAGWGSYTMWQWADSGVFPGDQDVFNGGTAALQQLAITGRAMAQPVIGAGDLNGDGKPDLLARRPDGTLWFYAGTGMSGGVPTYGTGTQIASGWGIYDEMIAAGDVNGDGKPDILARKTNGTMVLFPGTGVINGSNTGFGNAIVLSSGWDAFTDVIAAGDMNGDHLPDLLARKPDGTLWLYTGTGHVDGSSTGYNAGVQVGTVWNQFSQVLGVGDLDKDGWSDLLAFRPDGTLMLYRESASGIQPGIPISAPGLGANDLLVAAGDVNGDGRADLLSRTPSGALEFYAGGMFTKPAFGAAQTVGSGWDIFNRVVGAGDLTGDGNPDIISTDTSGNLWLYQGNGNSGGVNRSYKAGVRVGWGWSGFTTIIGGADMNGDGKPDLVAVRSDGSLWLFPGTGTVNPSSPDTFSGGIRIGSSGWSQFTKIVAGDFNGDGVTDILASTSDGTLFFYAGVRQTPSSTAWLQPGVVVGSGWNAISSIVATGDANGDGKADLVALKPDGTLWLYAGLGNTGINGSSGLANPAVIGSGWNIFSTVTGTGDTATGRGGDLLGVRTDGALLYYPGSGTAAVANIPGFSGAVQAGSSWNQFG